jgi:hypothetical protein
MLPLLALALSGCLSTSDEPFALDDSDAVAARPGDYACRTFDEHGVAKAERARLVRLERGGRTQYVFLAADESSVEPATLHRVAAGPYVVAVAHSGAPGEDLYRATVAADGASFQLYVPATLAAATALAQQSGATLVHNQFSDDLSGPLDAQRGFALALAADSKSWRRAADCRAQAR